MVTCGFEDASRDDAFALVSLCNWRINTTDIKSAFLEEKSIERDVFIKPSKVANTNKSWK